MAAFRHSVVPALILTAVLAVWSPAAGQSSQPSSTSADIQARIQKSAELQRQALQGLADPARAVRQIDQAYAELRAGLSAMVITASGMKFPDPLLDVNKKNGEQALALLQAARDVLKAPAPSPAPDGETPAPAGSRPRLDAVRADLERALRLTNSVIVH
jgi:hypothetical protein